METQESISILYYFAAWYWKRKGSSKSEAWIHPKHECNKDDIPNPNLFTWLVKCWLWRRRRGRVSSELDANDIAYFSENHDIIGMHWTPLSRISSNDQNVIPFLLKSNMQIYPKLLYHCHENINLKWILSKPSISSTISFITRSRRSLCQSSHSHLKSFGVDTLHWSIG